MESKRKMINSVLARAMFLFLCVVIISSVALGQSENASQIGRERVQRNHSLHPVKLPPGQPKEFTVKVDRNGHTKQLVLKRHSLKAPNFCVKVWYAGQLQDASAPNVTTYRGSLAGDPLSKVCATLGSRGLEAKVVEGDRQTWKIELQRGHRLGYRSANIEEEHLIIEGEDLSLDELGVCGACDNHDFIEDATPEALHISDIDGTLTTDGMIVNSLIQPSSTITEEPAIMAASCQMHQAEISFDCDYEFSQYFDPTPDPNDTDGTVARVMQILNEVDFFYARDVLITYSLVEIVVRKDKFYETNYGTTIADGNLLQAFRTEWNGEGVGTYQPHDLAHLMTEKSWTGGIAGLAWVGTVCTYSRYGWSRNSSGIVGHELGHNWGAGHCLDTVVCNNLCGSCLYIGPNTKAVIEAHRDSRWCLDLAPPYATPVPPYVTPESVSMTREELLAVDSLSFDVLANDHDANCDTLSLVGYDPVSIQGGTITDSDNILIYTPPDSGFLGLDTFTYIVGDGNDGQMTGTVSIESKGLAVQIDAPTVIGFSSEYPGGSWAANQAVDSTQLDWATNGDGANAYIDFDFGQAVAIDAFLLQDRVADVDRVNSFSLTFSDNSTFGDSDDHTETFTNNAGAAAQSYFFESQACRFIRFDAVDTAHDNSNTGLVEITFYQYKSNAPAYISPSNVTASASSEYATSVPAAHVTNGSGLTANTIHDNDGGAGTMWHGILGTPFGGISNLNPGTTPGAEWLKFEFNRIYKLGKTVIWNHNQANLTDRGMQDVYIEYSTDGVNYTNLLGQGNTFKLKQAPGMNGIMPSDMIDFAGVEARYIVITATTENPNYGGNVIGLSEIRFGLATLDESNITATASSMYSVAQSLTDIINGYSLDPNNLHDNNGNAETMWHGIVGPPFGGTNNLNSGTSAGAEWLKFEFDNIYSLNEMVVWNHNQSALTDRGMNEVYIEYSTDGINYTNLFGPGVTTNFTQASGVNGIAPTDVIDFGGVPVKFVVITATMANPNFGGNVIGMSEIQFCVSGIASEQPGFTSNPLVKSAAVEGTAYDASIAGDINNPSGLPLTFTKASGPQWLTVQPNGTLSGTPDNADVGENTFIVKAQDTEGNTTQSVLSIIVGNVFSGDMGIHDFVGLAENWRSTGCTDTPGCNGADLDGDGTVDLADLGMLADHWLAGIEPDLITYWNMNDSSGTILRDNYFSADGTFVNMDNSSWNEGKFGNGLRLDGIAGYIEIPHDDKLNLTAGFTISFWLKTDYLSDSHANTIISKGLASTTNYVIDMYKPSSGGGLRFFGYENGFVKGITDPSGPSLADGIWHHIACTFDGTIWTIYSNGQIYKSKTQPCSLTASSQTLQFGARQATANYTGMIDEIRLYDRALTLEEIAQITNLN